MSENEFPWETPEAETDVTPEAELHAVEPQATEPDPIETVETVEPVQPREPKLSLDFFRAWLGADAASLPIVAAPAAPAGSAAAIDRPASAAASVLWVAPQSDIT
mgnify:CR=1 FL=1